MNGIEHRDAEKVFVSRVNALIWKKKKSLAMLKTNRRTFVKVTWQTVWIEANLDIQFG